MRQIPDDILSRIALTKQTKANKANPNIKTYLSRGLINELFYVYTINESDSAIEVDTTIKSTSTSIAPESMYVICLDNGVASIKSRSLPYDEFGSWSEEFQVATDVTAVAIESNGRWAQDFDNGVFKFVTDEYPFIFYVAGGTLKVQLWQDASIDLATNVTKIFALRGWLSAAGDKSKDQGLVVGYIKTDGYLYYRNYCIQADSTVTWESERQVTALTASTITDFAIFRTNDYRLGFVVEYSDGSMAYSVTERNWSGMSFPVEVVDLTVDLTEVSFDIFELITAEFTMQSETVDLEVEKFGIFNVYEVGETPAINDICVIDTGILDNHHYFIQFNRDVYLWNSDLLIKSVSEYTIASAYIDGDKVYYTTVDAMSVEVLLSGFGAEVFGGIFYCVLSPSAKSFYAGELVQITGIIAPMEETVAMAVSISSVTFDLYELVTYSYLAQDETVSLSVLITSTSLTISEISTEIV